MTEFVLSEALLDNCAGRAAEYDRENRFFSEDLDELRASQIPARCGATRFRRPWIVAQPDMPRTASVGTALRSDGAWR